jgi:aspartate-semialdehyde dehydrogenase
MENGYTKEEMKMINETRKILKHPDLKITATAVRVPVINSHSESINVEFENDFDLAELVNTLKNFEGIVVVDNPENNSYPLATRASGHDEVFVGRIRRDESVPYGINFWDVADNIRKGAASNAVQIVKKLIEMDK